MSDIDLPMLDDSITQLPTDIREDLAERGRNDLYFLAKAILGYRDMTLKCHGPLCVFAANNPAQFKEMLMPRDHYKTTVVTISGNVQKILRNPEERILILNESATNAQRWIGSIKSHAETNRVFRALYSSIIPKDTSKIKWNNNELVFNRSGHYPEPTIDHIGMTGAMTSRHYTHICIDDPISEEAVKSELVMQDAITRMKAVLALLVKPERDTIWIVGTRWALHDIYSWFEKTLGKKLARFARAVLEDGEPIFPELMGHEMIALKRQMNGEYRFSCLYMNNPRNEELQDLNVNDLRYWRWSMAETHVELFNTDGSVSRTWSLDDLDITTTVDLAPAEKISSDRNAVVTVGISPLGEAIVLEAWGARCTPIELMEKLFDVKARFQPRAFGIEGVAYQKAFKYFLKEEARRREVYFNIVELTSTGKKEIRVRGIQPVMATGHLYINPEQNLLRNEMADFPLGEHDDVIDALSMQLQLWRGRLSPEHWAAYKKSEEEIIRKVMRRENPIGDGSPALDFDHEDGDADRPRVQWQEFIVG